MKKHNYKFVDTPFLVGFHPDFLKEEWIQSEKTIKLYDSTMKSYDSFSKDALFLVFATFEFGLGGLPGLEMIGPDSKKYHYPSLYSRIPEYPEHANRPIFEPVENITPKAES